MSKYSLSEEPELTPLVLMAPYNWKTLTSRKKDQKFDRPHRAGHRHHGCTGCIKGIFVRRNVIRMDIGANIDDRVISKGAHSSR